jgi:hypothetical protein
MSISKAEIARREHNKRAIETAFAKETKRRGFVTKAAPIGPAVREVSVDGLYRPEGAQLDVEASAYADTENSKLAARLEEFSGRGTVEDPPPAYAVDAFLHGDDDPNGGAPRPLGYAVVEDPGIASPKEMNFERRGTDDGLATPQNFRAPQPQRTRLGSGYVLKRVSFADVVYGTTNDQCAEAIEKSAKLPEPTLADILLGQQK